MNKIWVNRKLVFWKISQVFLFCYFKYFKKVNYIGNKVVFGNRIIINVGQDIYLHNKVVLGDDVWLHGEGGKILIGENSILGMRCVVSAAKQITIENNVLFAPNVFITDHLHNFQKITLPIMNQGIDKIAPVSIGSGSWLGINSVILPGVKVGKNCVVGANSVVTRSVPDFSVVAGSPAKIIKMFDKKKKKWVKYKKF